MRVLKKRMVWVCAHVREAWDYQREVWQERKEWAWEKRYRLCDRGAPLILVLSIGWTIAYGYLQSLFWQVSIWNDAVLEELEDRLWQEYPQCFPIVQGEIGRHIFCNVDIWIRPAVREYADDVARCAEACLSQPDAIKAAREEYLEKYSIPEYWELDFLTIDIRVKAGTEYLIDDIEISCPE